MLEAILKDKKILSQIKEKFLEKPNQESCGIIYKDSRELRFLSVENKSWNREKHFVIDPEIIIAYCPEYIVHSHVDSCANPSELDKKVSNELAIPYLIYSIKYNDFFLYKNIGV